MSSKVFDNQQRYCYCRYKREFQNPQQWLRNITSVQTEKNVRLQIYTKVDRNMIQCWWEFIYFVKVSPLEQFLTLL